MPTSGLNFELSFLDFHKKGTKLCRDVQKAPSLSTCLFPYRFSFLAWGITRHVERYVRNPHSFWRNMHHDTNDSSFQSWPQIQTPTLIVWCWHSIKFIWCEFVKFLGTPTIRLADDVVTFSWSQCSIAFLLMNLSSYSLIQSHDRNTIFIWVMSAGLDIITVKPKHNYTGDRLELYRICVNHTVEIQKLNRKLYFCFNCFIQQIDVFQDMQKTTEISLFIFDVYKRYRRVRQEKTDFFELHRHT